MTSRHRRRRPDVGADTGRGIVWITHDPTGLELVDVVLDLDGQRRGADPLAS